jgi:hypothetical protein
MLFHLAVVLLMLATVAAFLIIWYFWVKKRMESAFVLDDEQQVLFPFKYFSWILIGLLLITCLTQIHFMRVSSAVHERLAHMSAFYQSRNNCAAKIDELKVMVQNTRKDLNTGFARAAAAGAQARGLEVSSEKSDDPGQPRSAGITESVESRNAKPITVAGGALSRQDRGFEQEAKASTTQAVDEAKSETADESSKAGKGVWAMSLSMEGRVTVDSLRVRKDPEKDGKVVAKLKTGDHVKVTEKRIVDDGMWFRIITPSGKAGWVDFRFLRLQADSRTSPGA